MTKYAGIKLAVDDESSPRKVFSFPESNKKAIVEALKNLHIAYNKKHSLRKKDQFNMSDLYDLQNELQASKERCRTLEDELASIRQCLNESPLPKVRKTKDDILEFDNKSEFGDTIDGDSAQNSPEGHFYDSSKAYSHKKWKKIKEGKNVSRVSSTTTARQTPNETPSSSRQYRLNMAEMPFITGKSTGKSHSLSANIQEVLSLMKAHNLTLCKASSSRRSCQCKPARACGSSASLQSLQSKCKDSLDELKSQLYDEYQHLRVKHEKLSGLVEHGVSSRLKEPLKQLEQQMQLKKDQMRRISLYQDMESTQEEARVTTTSVHKCRSGDCKIRVKKLAKDQKTSTKQQYAELLRNLQEIQSSLK